jgi:hypothetical protein
MNYFRSFRLIGTEALDEYYSLANEVANYQNNIYKLRHENPAQDLTQIERSLDELHQNMYKKYGMIPYLHYHAMPETGYVSELVDTKTYKKRLRKGTVKDGQARKLEIARNEKKEEGYSIPVFKIDNPQSIKDFEKLLYRWQEIKMKVREAEKDNSPQLSSQQEQLEAFNQELKEKYRMNPDAQYVFETISIGVYMGCTEEHLKKIAIEQKKDREVLAKDAWKNNSKN